MSPSRKYSDPDAIARISDLLLRSQTASFLGPVIRQVRDLPHISMAEPHFLGIRSKR